MALGKGPGVWLSTPRSPRFRGARLPTTPFECNRDADVAFVSLVRLVRVANRVPCTNDNLSIYSNHNSAGDSNTSSKFEGNVTSTRHGTSWSIRIDSSNQHDHSNRHSNDTLNGSRDSNRNSSPYANSGSTREQYQHSSSTVYSSSTVGTCVTQP